MQQTSAAWKALWAAGNARLESAAVIDGHEYREITAPVISLVVNLRYSMR